jgi:hypothetical protein
VLHQSATFGCDESIFFIKWQHKEFQADLVAATANALTVSLKIN